MSARRDPIEYADASAEVRAVYDDIMATSKVDWVNNFWKVRAHDPPTLQRVWSNIKHVMAEQQLSELMAVIGLANETNRLATGYRVPVDARFTET